MKDYKVQKWKITFLRLKIKENKNHNTMLPIKVICNRGLSFIQQKENHTKNRTSLILENNKYTKCL